MINQEFTPLTNSLIPVAIKNALSNIDLSILVEKSERKPTIWVGLSAGVDSTVLLHALAYEVFHSRQAQSFNICAIHIHHGLSRNADLWAEQAEAFCKEISLQFSLDIPCVIERIELGNFSDGVEQAARQARYSIFEQHCSDGDVLFQGHHLDDQIETFFMRAVRGSGLTGLSGIPQERSLSRTNMCKIYRPLLMIEKTHIVSYAEKIGLVWFEDESNLDNRIERNWWRNELLPQIWNQYPHNKQALCRTINHVQHQQKLLEQFITDQIESQQNNSEIEAFVHPALLKLPRFDLQLVIQLKQEVGVSYIRTWLAQYVDILPSTSQMNKIYSDMIYAKGDAVPVIEWSHYRLNRYHNSLYLLNRKQFNFNRSSHIVYNWKGENLFFSSGELICSSQHQDAYLKPGNYHVRFWEEGDVAKPFGRATRKMKKWWQDYNVPSWVREYWPLIVDESNAIAAVPGLFVCQNYQTDKKDAWCVQWVFNN